MNDTALVEFLSTIEAFSPFDSNELEQLAASVVIKEYEFRKTILSTGDHGQGLYNVKSGRVRLLTEDGGK